MRILVGALAGGIVVGQAFAGAWDDSSPKVREWFQRLLVPGTRTPCCGQGNAVEADDFEVDGDQYVAVVTDGHGLVPDGTRILIPNHRRNFDETNPTGHGILFLDSGRQPICYVSPSGG
jgi:hypothetical protein